MIHAEYATYVCMCYVCLLMLQVFEFATCALYVLHVLYLYVCYMCLRFICLQVREVEGGMQARVSELLQQLKEKDDQVFTYVCSSPVVFIAVVLLWLS